MLEEPGLGERGVHPAAGAACSALRCGWEAAVLLQQARVILPVSPSLEPRQSWAVSSNSKHTFHILASVPLALELCRRPLPISWATGHCTQLGLASHTAKWTTQCSCALGLQTQAQALYAKKQEQGFITTWEEDKIGFWAVHEERGRPTCSRTAGKPAESPCTRS